MATLLIQKMEFQNFLSEMADEATQSGDFWKAQGLHTAIDHWDNISKGVHLETAYRALHVLLLSLVTSFGIENGERDAYKEVISLIEDGVGVDFS